MCSSGLISSLLRRFKRWSVLSRQGFFRQISVWRPAMNHRMQRHARPVVNTGVTTTGPRDEEIAAGNAAMMERSQPLPFMDTVAYHRGVDNHVHHGQPNSPSCTVKTRTVDSAFLTKCASTRLHYRLTTSGTSTPMRIQGHARRLA